MVAGAGSERDPCEGVYIGHDLRLSMEAKTAARVKLAFRRTQVTDARRRLSESFADLVARTKPNSPARRAAIDVLNAALDLGVYASLANKDIASLVE